MGNIDKRWSKILAINHSSIYIVLKRRSSWLHISLEKIWNKLRNHMEYHSITGLVKSFTSLFKLDMIFNISPCASVATRIHQYNVLSLILNMTWNISFAVHMNPSWTQERSSGSTGPKALSYLVPLDIYWIHKWYIYVFPIIYQLTFSAAPPFCPVLCNHSWMEFKLGRTNATWLWVVGLNNYLNTCIFCHLFLWDIKYLLPHNAPHKKNE